MERRKLKIGDREVELNVQKGAKIKKGFSRDKLVILSRKYAKKMKETPEEHDNFVAIFGVVDGMFMKAEEAGLIGYKAKHYWKVAKSGKKKHENISKALALTSRK